jgi:alkyldihydroxyacetonephosphate synthase
MNFDSLAQEVPRARLLTGTEDVAPYAADWSALAILRGARGDLTAPAAVLQPASGEDVARTLRWASDNVVAVVPAGGRSGVSGGTITHGGEVVIDMRAMGGVLDLDQVSGVVHVQAGILGTELEEWLNQRGHTLGHFPQSVGLSTVGGWIAARSAGQLSSGYGAVEDFLVGLTAALPDGQLVSSRLAPRTAAGPQIYQLLLGSEGTLGVVTEAWLRVRRAPAERRLASVQFESFQEGLDAARRMAQSRALPDALRVYDETDTTIAFRSMEPPPSGECAVLVVEGDEGTTDARMTRALQLAEGKPAAQDLAGYWWEHRNDAVNSYRRILAGELFGPDGVVDTMEVAALWSRIPALYDGVRTALTRHAQIVGCHCSHTYETGCALYYTFLLQAAEREQALIDTWSDALDAALNAGGTITHHHGIGQLKAPWLGRELGGFAPYLGKVQAAFDPAGIMNPHTLRVR